MDRIDLINRKIRIHTILLGLFSFILMLYSMNIIIKFNQENHIVPENSTYETICDHDCKNKKLSLIQNNALQQ